ncbi:MAG: fluoride efflux transporter CrcB [Chloroflexota bacterium]
MERLLWILVAGGLGALARYGISAAVQSRTGAAFPWGILVVNCVGSFLFGLLYSLAEERGVIGPELRVALMVGFLGALTTFSSFAFDTGQLMRDGRWLWAAGNIALNNVLAIGLIFAGMAAGRAV